MPAPGLWGARTAAAGDRCDGVRWAGVAVVTGEVTEWGVKYTTADAVAVVPFGEGEEGEMLCLQVCDLPQSAGVTRTLVHRRIPQVAWVDA